MASPLGQNQPPQVDTAKFKPISTDSEAVPKFERPGKMGSKTIRLHFADDKIPKEFSLALCSGKPIADINIASERSLLDRVYAWATGHDRFVVVNVGTPAKPAYLKVNYNSIQQRLFQSALTLTKRLDGLTYRPEITTRDFEDLEKLKHLKQAMAHLTSLEEFANFPTELRKLGEELKPIIESTIKDREEYFPKRIGADLLKLEEDYKYGELNEEDLIKFEDLLPKIQDQFTERYVYDDYQARFDVIKLKSLFAKQVKEYESVSRDFDALKNDINDPKINKNGDLSQELRVKLGKLILRLGGIEAELKKNKQALQFKVANLKGFSSLVNELKERIERAEKRVGKPILI